MSLSGEITDLLSELDLTDEQRKRGLAIITRLSTIEAVLEDAAPKLAAAADVVQRASDRLSSAD